MPQYRLKTNLYDAVQFTGDAAQAEALVAAMFSNVKAEMQLGEDAALAPTWTGNLLVASPEGTQIAQPNDYILTNTEDNSRIVVSAADFAALYEEDEPTVII